MEYTSLLFGLTVYVLMLCLIRSALAPKKIPERVIKNGPFATKYAERMMASGGWYKCKVIEHD